MPYARPATIEDAKVLGPILRKADRDEMKALFAQSPTDLLIESVTIGTETLSVVADDGSVIGMFGYHHAPSEDPLEAAVWFVSSDAIYSIKSEFLRQTIPWLQKFHQKCPLLWNIVDARNTVHIRWLKRFGFHAIHRHPHLGIEQRPFIEFVRIDPSCVTQSPPA